MPLRETSLEFAVLRRSSIAPGGADGQPTMRFGLFLLLVFTARSLFASDESMMLQGVAQGTTWHVKFVPPNSTFDAAALQTAIEEKLAEIDRQMSTYRPDSEISRFNRAPAGDLGRRVTRCPHPSPLPKGEGVRRRLANLSWKNRALGYRRTPKFKPHASMSGTKSSMCG